MPPSAEQAAKSLLTGGATAYARRVQDWREAGIWTGQGLEREVFYFPAGGHDLYGSFYAGVPRRRAYGLVICSGWAVEELASFAARGLALRAAELGSVALIFHHPGAGDSLGDLAKATMSTLREAVIAAVAAAENRAPGTRWILVGMTLGAAAAALAWREAGVDGLLFLQPALDPDAYFQELISRARRFRLGDPSVEEFVYGHPLPDWVRSGAGSADSPGSALKGFGGDGAVIHYAQPPPRLSSPDGFETIVVPGTFQRGWKNASGEVSRSPVGELNNDSELVAAAIDWLERLPGRRMGAPSAARPPEGERSSPGRAKDGVTDYPVLVSTSCGVVGAIVTEPKSDPLAQLVLLNGGGDTRAGVNGHWARHARALAGLGIQSLRADWATKGESHMAGTDGDLAAYVGELVSWFREDASGVELLILGYCYGSKAAIELAAERSDTAALGLIATTLAVPGHRVLDRALPGRSDGRRLDPAAVKAVRALLERMPVWLLTGELDDPDLILLERRLATAGGELELTVVEGHRLHGFGKPAAQDAAHKHIVEWAARILAAKTAGRHAAGGVP